MHDFIQFYTSASQTWWHTISANIKCIKIVHWNNKLVFPASLLFTWGSMASHCWTSEYFSPIGKKKFINVIRLFYIKHKDIRTIDQCMCFYKSDQSQCPGQFYCHQNAIKTLPILWDGFALMRYEYKITIDNHLILSENTEWNICSKKEKKKQHTLFSLSYIPPICWKLLLTTSWFFPCAVILKWTVCMFSRSSTNVTFT